LALVLILALFMAGTAVALAARAVLLPRIRADRNVGRIAAYGYAGAEATVEAPGRKAVLPRIAAGIGEIFERGRTSERRNEVRKLLRAAGFWEANPSSVLGYRVLGTGLFGSCVLYMSTKGGWSPFMTVVSTGYGIGLGWIGPMFVLKARARRRTERIELDLPEMIDLLVVTLEAGVGFTGALTRSTERLTGPLGDEIRLTLREHNLGLSMNNALTNFLDRCDVPSVRAFVRSVIQSEALGVSIGQVMRDLATEMRTRRRQIVEEKAQKAPIKMLFPLAFLILPALLLIVLYPGLENLVQTLRNTGT
jgi:tight adherence protein C